MPNALPAPNASSTHLVTALLVITVAAVLCAASPAAAETLRVRTVDPLTGEPIANAFVMVGSAPGVPFAGNSGLTDASGAITFDDPALVTPATVSAGTADRAYVTTTASPADSVVFGLPLRLVEEGVPPPVARVTGTAPGIPVANNDGNVELGFVLPAVDVEALLGTGQLPFGVPIEIVNLPLLGDVEVPGIAVIPDQVELLFFSFGKPVYQIDLRDGATESLFCPAGRIALADLAALGGDDIFDVLNQIDISKFGIERDRVITNGAVIDIGVDLPANTSVTVQFVGVPPADDIQLLSGAVLPVAGGSGERYVLFDGSGQPVGQGTQLAAASVVPSGDIADATNAFIAIHADSSSALAYSSAIIDRSGWVPPANRVADSFFRVPDVVEEGRVVTHTDPENPGVSPVPTWVNAVYALEGDSGDPAVVSGIHWRVVAPAGDLGFTLPELPPSAPPALPDPQATPGDDRLALTLTASDNSAGPQEVLVRALGDATHVVYRTIEVEPSTTPIADAVAPVSPTHVLGLAFPDPSPERGAAVTLPVLVGASGRSAIDIYDAGGRLVRRLVAAGAPGATVMLRWDGRDARGRAVPAGTYFARAAGTQAVEKLVVVH
ncbi:MAG: FlgD immunoglobulin-like domain containing protein [Candidatus Eiseniibacteriota bacterium]|jgi:hypothetical protein